MMNTYRVSTLVLALACLIPAAPARSDEVRHAVEAGNRSFVAAFLRGDAKAIANLYTEDALVMAPGSAATSGRQAIAAFWQGSIDSGTTGLTLETTETESAGDLAYELGNVRLVAKDGTTSEARYVVVWKRIDGKWMLHRDIWNSSE